MSTIVTRAGKGSALTHNEVDTNFTNLNTDKIEAAQSVTLTNKTLSTGTAITAGTINNATIGASTPSSGAFTTLSASSTVSGTGFSTYLASPPAIGGTAAAAGSFTTLSATGVTTVQAGTAAAPAITTSGDSNTGIFYPAADTVAIGTNGTERVRVVSAGDVGIGTSTPATISNRTVLSINNASNGGALNLLVNGTETLRLLTDNSSFGYVYNIANQPLLFGTNNTERMRLDASGNLLLGGTSQSGTANREAVFSANKFGLAIIDTSSYATGVGGALNLGGNYRVAGDAQAFCRVEALKENATDGNYAYAMAFSTTPNGGTFTERARITSGGDFYVGDTNNTLGNTRLYIKGDGTNPASRIWANTSTTSVYGLVVRHESTTAGAYIQFVTDSNVETGRIYDLAGTMQYASSSDARLKTNVQPMQNSLQSVLALNPCTFDMRRGEDTFIPSAGLIAQEVHEVYPFVVGVGGDDENTNPWSVDYGKLTPLLVAAIKEQQAMIDELKAKVAALENA
jgi:hypothetical protein